MKRFFLLLVGIQLAVGSVLVKAPAKPNETRLHKILNPAHRSLALNQILADVKNPNVINLRKIPGVEGLTLGDLYVGPSRQFINVSLTLDTTHTWITGTGCKSKCEDFCSNAAICQLSCSSSCCVPQSGNPEYSCLGKHKYDTKSATFSESRPGKTWEIGQEKQQTVDGIYGKDNFQFGYSGAFKIAKGAEFGVATTISLAYTLWKADGVLGLGKKPNNAADTKSVVSTLQPPIFQILPLVCDSKNQCGYISFGTETLTDLNVCKKDNGITFKTNTNSWGFEINELTLNDKTSKDTLQIALDLDSGFVTLNDKLFEQVKTLTNAQYNTDSQLYVVDCSVKFNWRMSSNGRNYLVLDEKVFVSTPDPVDKTCYLKVQQKYSFDKSKSDIVFGLPVLNQFCTTYKLNDETVTFYELK